jgi:hypothetical protein
VSNTQLTDMTECPEWAAEGEPAGIRIVGDQQEWPLTGDAMTVGRAPTCDIQIASSRVSTHHCTLERRGARWFAVDNKSSNGILDEYLVARQEIELRAGVVWYVAKTPVEPFSLENKRARAALLPIVGMVGAWPAYVDAALAGARGSGPIVIVTPPGGGGDKAAALLHGASPRRWLPLATVGSAKEAAAVVASATRSSAAIHSDDIPRDASVLQEVCLAHSVRLLVISRRPVSPDQFGGLLNGAVTLPIRPLSERRDELSAIIEHLASQFRQRLQQPHLQLRPELLEQAKIRTWRRNLEDLEMFIERALVLQAHGGRHNRTADALNVAPSTLSKWRRRYGG